MLFFKGDGQKRTLNIISAASRGNDSPTSLAKIGELFVLCWVPERRFRLPLAPSQLLRYRQHVHGCLCQYQIVICGVEDSMRLNIQGVPYAMRKPSSAWRPRAP